MNRREMIAAALGIFASEGVKAQAEVIESEPKPFCLVVKVNAMISEETASRLRQQMLRIVPGVPVVVIDESMDIYPCVRE